MQARSVFAIPVLTLAVLLAGATAYAGPLTGRIVDPGGAPVAGAQVLVSGDGGALRIATSDSRGEFSLLLPDSGRFDARVASAGFRAETVSFEASAEPRDLGTFTLAISAISESVVVSAAQVEIPLSQAAASVTVITAAEIEARQLHTLADALRAVPGMTVVATGGYGAVTGVFPRGGESDYTLVFIDGVQANGFGGEFDFAHVSTANLERIEIVRGPQSALFGSNAIGSVVRVITRRGGPLQGAASLEGGSFGTARAAAGASGSRGPWEWGASAERLESDGMNGQRTAAGHTVANDGYLRQSASASAGWRRDDGAMMRADARFARDDRGFPGPFGTNPIGAYSRIDEVSRGEYDRWTAALSGALPLGSRVRLHAQLGYNRVGGDFLSPFGASESSSRRVNGRVQSDLSIAPGLDASAGIDLLAERAGSTYITGADFQAVPVRRSVAGYFAEARWQRAQRFFVTAGVRLDDIRRDALESNPDPFSPRPELPDDTTRSVNPKIAAAWYVRPGASYTKVRASAGTGIRPPDGFELAFTDNPSLRPERSRSVETAIEQAMAGGRLVFEAAAFHNDYDDLIIAVGSFVEASRFRTDNISNARSRGLELSASGRARLATATPIDLDARIGYTWLDTSILAVDEGQAAPQPFAVGDPLVRRPRHQVAVDLSLRAGRLDAWINGGARGRVLDVEPSFGTFGGLFYANGYSVWNTGASWRLGRGVDLFGRVTNVLDREYEEALGFPALGRGALAGVRIAAGR